MVVSSFFRSFSTVSLLKGRQAGRLADSCIGWHVALPEEEALLLDEMLERQPYSDQEKGDILGTASPRTKK